MLLIFNLRTILYTDRPLSGNYKDVSPRQEKSNIIYKFSCHCGSDYVGKTSQSFYVRTNQHVPKFLKTWFDGRSKKPTKRYFSAIGQHLLDNILLYFLNKLSTGKKTVLIFSCKTLFVLLTSFNL